MSGLVTVFAKECRDNLRDRRTLLSSFSLSVLGPMLFTGLMALVLNTTLGEAREPFRLTVVGAEHAPGLMRHLEQQNVVIVPVALDDPRAAVAAREHQLVLVIEPEYRDRFVAGEINSLALVYDSSGMGTAQRNVMLTRQMVQGYAQRIGRHRLELRGIEPRIVSPVLIDEVDIATPAARALTVLAMLPYLLVLVIFMGGFYLAIDATAGEREHGSLEPLLSQPVSRLQLVLGKLLAVSVFSALSLALFIGSLAASLPFVPLHRVGMSLSIGPGSAFAMFAASAPLVLFGAALLTVVASFAKSYKEAQTYLTVVILIPTLPLIVTQLLKLETSPWLMLVPSLSQAELVSTIIRGESPAWTHVALSAFGTGGGTALLAWIAIALYRRERILV
jgi:sodium transport system permease protein